MSQLNLLGESPENEHIKKEITDYFDLLDMFKWILSDECKWKEHEKVEWYIREGGQFEVFEEGKIDIETEFKNQMKFIEERITELRGEIIKRKW